MNKRSTIIASLVFIIFFLHPFYVQTKGNHVLAYNPLNLIDYTGQINNLFEEATNRNISTDVPRLVNTDNLSGRDLVTVLKAVAILTINLFLIVLETVTGILKALLPFLNS